MDFLRKIRAYLLAWGIPGLFSIAFLDSAGIPMVGGPDAVLMLLAWNHPARLPLIVLAATAGSTLGCLVLYRIGQKGGDFALHKFQRKTRERVRRKLEENDVLAVFLAVIAPPPSPTKLLILAAGVIEMSPGRFVVGVLGGRFSRYLIEGYLGARFGEQAAEVLKEEYPMILVVMAAGIAIFFLGKRWKRRRTGSREA